MLNTSKVDFFEVHPYRCIVLNKKGEIVDCIYCSNMSLLEQATNRMMAALNNIDNSALVKQLWSRGMWEAWEIITREGTEHAA